MAKDANVTEALPQITTNKDSLEEKTLEQLPEFPGGIVEFMKWLTRNLHYPPLARQQKIEGKVVVSLHHQCGWFDRLTESAEVSASYA